MGIGGFLDQEGIDRAAFTDQGHVRLHLFIERLQISQVGGAGKVPVVGVADNEIEDVFPLGQDQDSGVPGLGPDFDNLVGLGLDAKDARGLSCRLFGGRSARTRRRSATADEKDSEGK